jgi:hypothetical protein
VKCFEYFDTEFDKYRTHDERSEDTPEEDFVLVDFSYFEVGENHDKDKEIIHAERLFHDIRCHEFECFLATHPVSDKCCKDTSEPNPYCTPDKSFFCFYFVRFFIEYAEIENEHDDYENKKSLPKICLNIHNKKIK